MFRGLKAVLGVIVVCGWATQFAQKADAATVDVYSCFSGQSCLRSIDGFQYGSSLYNITFARQTDLLTAGSEFTAFLGDPTGATALLTSLNSFLEGNNIFGVGEPFDSSYGVLTSITSSTLGTFQGTSRSSYSPTIQWQGPISSYNLSIFQTSGVLVGITQVAAVPILPSGLFLLSGLIFITGVRRRGRPSSL